MLINSLIQSDTDKTDVSLCLCALSELDYLAVDILTSVLWIHMRRVEAEVDEEGDRHSKLEPLHHIGGLLAVQGRGHVTPQDHALSGARRHKPGLLSHSVGTSGEKETAFYYKQGFFRAILL